MDARIVRFKLASRNNPHAALGLGQRSRDAAAIAILRRNAIGTTTWAETRLHDAFIGSPLPEIALDLCL